MAAYGKLTFDESERPVPSQAMQGEGLTEKQSTKICHDGE